MPLRKRQEQRQARPGTDTRTAQAKWAPKSSPQPTSAPVDTSASEKMPEIGGVASLRAFYKRQPVWIILAVSSGACAAINGVFAKLTTTSLTSSWSSALASLFGLAPENVVINFGLRAFFFGMNLLFNLAMWTLFTAALTRASSTTRVSIVNVSANFMVTALLGWMVFGEQLKGLWWVGAALLAAGNVVIGRREEGGKPGGTVGSDETREEAEGLMGEREGLEVRAEEEVDLVEFDEDGEGRARTEEEARIRKAEDVDAPI